MLLITQIDKEILGRHIALIFILKKKKEILPFAMTYLNLEDSMPGKISWRQTVATCSYMWNLKLPNSQKIVVDIMVKEVKSPPISKSRFDSHLFSFESNSMLTYLERQQIMTQTFGTYVEIQDGICGSWLSYRLGHEPMGQRYPSLYISDFEK